MVLRGDAELGLTRDIEDDGVESVVPNEDGMVLVAGAAAKVRDPLRLSPTSPSSPRSCSIAARAIGGLRWTCSSAPESRSTSASRSKRQRLRSWLLRELPAVALLPSSTVRTEVQRGELGILRVVDAALPTRRFVAIHRRGVPTVEASEFFATLMAWIGGYPEQLRAPRQSGAPAPRRIAAIDGADASTLTPRCPLPSARTLRPIVREVARETSMEATRELGSRSVHSGEWSRVIPMNTAGEKRWPRSARQSTNHLAEVCPFPAVQRVRPGGEVDPAAMHLRDCLRSADIEESSSASCNGRESSTWRLPRQNVVDRGAPGDPRT
jgi:hypothetical protein